MKQLAAALWLAALVASCTERAPPMDGVCTPVLAKEYIGDRATSPTLSCLWSGRRWECTKHGGGQDKYWSCEDVGAAPAEGGGR